MDSFSTIDSEFVNSKIKLNSKLTIVLISVFASPFLATIVYGLNLYKANKQSYFIGVLIAILASNFFLRVGFLGFNDEVIRLIFLLFNLLMGLLLVGPFWKKHFSLKSKFDYKNNWYLIVLCVSSFYGYLLLFNVFVNPFKFEGNWEYLKILISPSFAGNAFFLVLLVIIIFLYRILVATRKLIKGKT